MTKEERDFRASHADDYLVLTAWGDWHESVPKGKVAVFAGRGGRQANGQYPNDTAYFLVDKTEYIELRPSRFVVDLSRHQQVAPIR